MKIKTHLYDHPSALGVNLNPETNLPCYGVLVDLVPGEVCYWWDRDSWKPVKGLRCWVPMCGITRHDDVFEADTPPLDTEEYVLHIYIHSGLRGLLLCPS